MMQKKVTIKNNAPFINCISKINGVKVDNAEDLDVVVPMCNLPSNPLSSNSESFKYKTIITANTYNIDEKITDVGGNEVNNPKYDANKVGKNETELVIPLKHLSNFWESLNIPLINCEVKLI